MRGLFEWTYKPDVIRKDSADVIIGMAFGANRRGLAEFPGISNIRIAQIIYAIQRETHLPVIAQREVAEAIDLLNLPIEPALIISEPEDHFHIDSFQVLQQAWSFCSQRQFTRAAIVAHPAHILRCAAVAEKLGFVVSLPNVSSVPYEPGSKQWWTRNKLSFFLWEFVARIVWRLKRRL